MRPLKRCGEGPSQDAKLSSGTTTLKLRCAVRGESVAKEVRCRHLQRAQGGKFTGEGSLLELSGSSGRDLGGLSSLDVKTK